MAFILSLASPAGPDVFIGDGIGVFRRYGYVAVGEGFDAFARPNEMYEKRRLGIEGIYKEAKLCTRSVRWDNVAYHSLNSFP